MPLGAARANRSGGDEKSNLYGDSDWLARRSTSFLSFQPQPEAVIVFVGEKNTEGVRFPPGMWLCVRLEVALRVKPSDLVYFVFSKV